MIGRLWHWLSGSLSRRLLATLAAVLALVSLPALILISVLYLQRLEDEQNHAAARFAALTEASLRPAMARRDPAEIQAILDGLAGSADIAAVSLLDAGLQPGFSAGDPASVAALAGEADLAAALTAASPQVSAAVAADGQRLRRAALAVPNGPDCVACHGAVADHPVLGLLVLDYAAAEAFREARNSALGLAAIGVFVTLVATAAMWATVRHAVVRPIGALTRTVQNFRDGAAKIPVDQDGHDEVADLRRSFAVMANDLGQTLARLHGSEERLQAILDAIPDAIRVIDQDYRIVKANRAYAQQVGQPLDRVLGQPCYRSSHNREAPCPDTLVRCPLQELRGKSEPLTCRQTHFGSDGSELHVEIAAAPVDLGSKEAPRPCVVEAIRDLDRQAQLGQEHRLAELGLLAAGLGHEIFNPLSSISLVAGAIEQDVEAGDMARLTGHLATLRAEVERTLTLTNSLLTLCQPPGEERAIDLATVVPQTLELLEFKAREAMVDLATDLAPGLWVTASESDLRMSLSNLVLNGIHAMPGGGAVTVKARRVGDEIRLEVIDTGHGIAPDDLRRILLPFWTRRADGSHGSGLGLPLVLAAMERARGRLEVESIPGAGSRFTLVYPKPEART